MTRRDWAAAREKVARERVCRVCGLDGMPVSGGGRIEAAHLAPRRYDPLDPATGGQRVDPGNIVPLCQAHHEAFDAHRLDLLPYVTAEEQAVCVAAMGGIIQAYQRLTGARWSGQPAAGRAYGAAPTSSSSTPSP